MDPPPALDPPDQSTTQWKDGRTMSEETRNKIINYIIDTQTLYSKACEIFGYKHFCDLIKMRAPPEAKDDQDHWYFVTLIQPDVDKTWTRIDKTVSRILNSKQVRAIEWAYVRELTSSETPHIHMRLRVPAYLDFRVIRKFNDNYRIDVQLERAGCYNYLIAPDKKHPTGEWFYKSNNYTGPCPEAPVGTENNKIDRKSNELISDT